MKRTTIGRDEQNDIVLTDQTVSRQHAELEETGSNRYVLKDLGSTFGTRIIRDGEWLEILEIEVRKNTRISLGEYETTVEELLALALASAGDETTASGEPGPLPAKEAAPPATTTADFFRDNRLWVILGGAGFILVVAIGVALGLYLTPGAGSTGMRAHLTTACLKQSKNATVRLCRCRVGILYEVLTPKERDVLFDLVKNQRKATKMKALPPDQRNKFLGRLRETARRFKANCKPS